MTHEPETTARDRRRFLAALALFLLWVAALVGLAVVSGYRPMNRAGDAPPALVPGPANDGPVSE